MKVFSIRQPIASLVMMGVNITDTITWDMKYRGRVLIHSNQVTMRYKDCVQSERFSMLHEYVLDVRSLPYGCFLGVANLMDIKPIHELKHFVESPECKLANYGERKNGYGLVFEDLQQFGEPIPAKGRLGFWEFEDYAVSDVLMSMVDELKGVIVRVDAKTHLVELRVDKRKFMVDPFEQNVLRWETRDMLPNRSVRFEGHFQGNVFVAEKMVEQRKPNR